MTCCSVALLLKNKIVEEQVLGEQRGRVLCSMAACPPSFQPLLFIFFLFRLFFPLPACLSFWPTCFVNLYVPPLPSVLLVYVCVCVCVYFFSLPYRGHAAASSGDALAADEGGPPEAARSTIGSGAEPCATEDEEELEEEMALAAAAAAAAAGLPGLLREEEMERAYEIFCGGEELTFQRFLTGIGVLG